MPVFRLPLQIVFPDPDLAEDNGLIAIGGDLTTDRLIAAYSAGIFPWYSEEQPILWFSPDPRMVLYPSDFKQSQSLARVLKSGKFSVAIDRDFPAVIEACASVPRPGQEGTWITQDMQQSYIELHRQGLAHSFETYQDGQLVGGLYGVSLGRAFFGESMFHRATDASKIALATLVDFALEHRFHFIDAQTPTRHLESLGAIEVPRPAFLNQLRRALSHPTLKSLWSI